jgi:hypothetical protein
MKTFLILLVLVTSCAFLTGCDEEDDDTVVPATAWLPV